MNIEWTINQFKSISIEYNRNFSIQEQLIYIKKEMELTKDKLAAIFW